MLVSLLANESLNCTGKQHNLGLSATWVRLASVIKQRSLLVDEVLSICPWVLVYVCECMYIHIRVCDCWNSSLQEGTGRPVASSKATTCAELVLDVSPKTQRVILKKKVRPLSIWSLEGETVSPGGGAVAHRPDASRGGARGLSCSSWRSSSCPVTPAPGIPSPSHLWCPFWRT